MKGFGLLVLLLYGAPVAIAQNTAAVGAWETASVVDAEMFVGHENIENLRIVNVSHFNGEALARLNNLESIYISCGEGEQYITADYDGRVFGCSQPLEQPRLRSVVLKNSFRSVWDFAGMRPFYIPLNTTPLFTAFCADNLEYIELPEDVMFIRQSSFCGSQKLTHVELPPMVAIIDGAVFSDCPNLMTVTCRSGMPPELHVQDDFIRVDKSEMTLHVPRGFKKAYSSHYVWGKFGTIVEDEDLSCSYDCDMLPDKYDPLKFALPLNQYLGVRYALINEDNNELAAVAPYYVINGFENDGYPLFYSYGAFNESIQCSVKGISPVVTQDGIEYRVTSVGRHAFSGLEHNEPLEIPYFIRYIGAGAFYHHEGLEVVRVNCSVPPETGDRRVFGDKSNLTLEVPVGSIGAYLAAEVWQDFGVIVENPELSGVETVVADEVFPHSVYYALDGRILSHKPSDGTIYIVRNSDGSAVLMR